MAIAFDAVTTVTQQTGASPFTVSHTTAGSNRFLIVAILRDSGTTISGITYGGAALTKLTEVNDANQGWYVELWYRLNPASGANDVVISYTLGVFVSAQIVSYTGAHQSSFPDSSASQGNGGATSTSRTGSTTVVASNCWLFMAAVNNVEASTAGSGTTLRGTQTGTGRLGAFDSNGTVGTGSQSLVANITSAGHWAHIIASIAPSVEANTGNFFQLF